MPIHHKALDKKRIKRKKKPSNESRGLVRALTKSCLTRSNSEVEIEPERRPDTPKYLKETYDYDASSSSSEEETAAAEDGK